MYDTLTVLVLTLYIYNTAEYDKTWYDATINLNPDTVCTMSACIHFPLHDELHDYI